MSVSEASILVVDDSEVTRNMLISYFEEEGYRILGAETAEEAEECLAREAIDLVLLDIRLPGKDGLTLTRELRTKSEIGIILVTGRQDEIDRIIGLECGADEYVTKPFNPREILARAKNLIRRVQKTRQQHPESRTAAVQQIGEWSLDSHRRLLSDKAGDSIQLTEGEFQLLSVMMENGGQTMSRDQLMERLKNRSWNASDRTIDVLIGRLRKKLRDDPCSPRIIVTVHGAGYLFSPCEPC
ncbi:response regulator [Motiliproteus sp. SC1-56]|uniref:response regulator n=1 Tax=Motiliproteus sp. SC1-56 TaxID=2799565 RepID=UPI001A8F8D99|nr:response regulator [Motiliproteus sp. SC1-56]